MLRSRKRSQQQRFKRLGRVFALPCCVCWLLLAFRVPALTTAAEGIPAAASDASTDRGKEAVAAPAGDVVLASNKSRDQISSSNSASSNSQAARDSSAADSGSSDVPATRGSSSPTKKPAAAAAGRAPATDASLAGGVPAEAVAAAAAVGGGGADGSNGGSGNRPGRLGASAAGSLSATELARQMVEMKAENDRMMEVLRAQLAEVRNKG